MSPGEGWVRPLDEERIVGVREETPLPKGIQEFLDAANAVPYGLEHRRALPEDLLQVSPPDMAALRQALDRPHVTGDGEVMCWCRPFRTATMWVHHDSRVPMGHGIIVPLEGGYAMGGKPNPGTKKDKRLKKNKKR